VRACEGRGWKTRRTRVEDASHAGGRRVARRQDHDQDCGCKCACAYCTSLLNFHVAVEFPVFTWRYCSDNYVLGVSVDRVERDISASNGTIITHTVSHLVLRSSVHM
jgi:hypothetical protein